jgi:Sec-independent protein secretion pathway component TatC
MKIKFLKIFSIILQILGLIFLILIITPFVTDFYFSFNKQPLVPRQSRGLDKTVNRSKRIENREPP